MHSRQWSGAAAPFSVKYFPALQGMQGEVLPSLTLYLPASHKTHGYGPDSSLNLPAEQGTQTSLPAATVKPASHWQSLLLSLPKAEFVCVGHLVHADDAGMLLNVPMAHDVQLPEPFAGL